MNCKTKQWKSFIISHKKDSQKVMNFFTAFVKMRFKMWQDLIILTKQIYLSFPSHWILITHFCFRKQLSIRWTITLSAIWKWESKINTFNWFSLEKWKKKLKRKITKKFLNYPNKIVIYSLWFMNRQYEHLFYFWKFDQLNKLKKTRWHAKERSEHCNKCCLHFLENIFQHIAGHKTKYIFFTCMIIPVRQHTNYLLRFSISQFCSFSWGSFSGLVAGQDIAAELLF